jgi:hypothetical protein
MLAFIMPQENSFGHKPAKSAKSTRDVQPTPEQRVPLSQLQ